MEETKHNPLKHSEKRLFNTLTRLAFIEGERTALYLHSYPEALSVERATIPGTEDDDLAHADQPTSALLEISFAELEQHASDISGQLSSRKLTCPLLQSSVC